uniref:Uncharacterized protein n=1 Tax=Arundo donax TaxID=35708 RepID=A0A0A8ZVA0_ARUDO
MTCERTLLLFDLNYI